MGILPGVLLLTLLSANLGEATEIPPKHLHNIVEQFAGRAGNTPGGELKQFAFLMVLKGDQCSNGINNFQPRVPQESAAPTQNYISFYPGQRPNMNGKYCSETRMLFSEGTQSTPVERFANTINDRQFLKDGGCVIFYTTNTPCTSRCFNENCDWDIVKPLNSDPFVNWKNIGNVHMYFVYSKPYVPKAYLDNTPATKQKKYNELKALTEKGFESLNPNNNRNPYKIFHCTATAQGACTPCDKKNHFCLVWPPV